MLAGCGSGHDTVSQTDTSAPVVVQRCGPQSAATQLGSFLEAVSARDRQAALRRVALPSKLLVVTVYHGERGDGRVDAQTPSAVYRSFEETIPAGQATSLLAVGVGTAPFAASYAKRDGGRTLGVEFDAQIGLRVLSGKIGIDCDSGRMYLGAMQVARHLRPQKLCGQDVRIGAARPILCRLD
jgi:hypothetical protein